MPYDSHFCIFLFGWDYHVLWHSDSSCLGVSSLPQSFGDFRVVVFFPLYYIYNFNLVFFFFVFIFIQSLSWRFFLILDFHKVMLLCVMLRWKPLQDYLIIMNGAGKSYAVGTLKPTQYSHLQHEMRLWTTVGGLEGASVQ